jgi:Smg protein
MNENLLDVLLYLFENFSLTDAESMRNVRADLDDAGFFPDEIDDAFAWIRATQPQGRERICAPTADAIRVYTDSELGILDAQCRGMIARLERAGVLSAQSREIVIDRMVALAADETEGADIEQLKWVVMMVLSSTGQEHAHARTEAVVHGRGPGASRASH